MLRAALIGHNAHMTRLMLALVLIGAVRTVAQDADLAREIEDHARDGVVPSYVEGVSVIDTRLEGNWNTGHEFRDGKGPGVIGRALSSEERAALIEYVKTL